MQVTQKRKGLRPELIPPRGSKPVGVHTDGRTIYELDKLDLQATQKNKKQVLDPDGKPKWRKHTTTGEKLYPIMQSEPVFKTIRFVLDRSPVGKVSINEYFECTPEERALDERRAKVTAFSQRLAELATDRGIAPEAVIDRLLDEAGENVAEALPYPQHKGGGYWLLSNGETYRGSRDDAEIQEAALHVSVPAAEEDDENY